MSLFFYDRAMYERLQGLYDEVIFASPDEAFKVNAQKHNGKVVMPFVSCYRLPDFSLNRAVHNEPRTRSGYPIHIDESGNPMSPLQVAQSRARGDNIRLRKVHGIPVMLTYQVDVYAVKRMICDGLAAEIVLNFNEMPFINVNMEEYRIGQHQFSVVMSESINDNTSISEFEDSGRIYRLTVEFVVNEAIIYRTHDEFKKVVKKVLVDVGEVDYIPSNSEQDYFYEKYLIQADSPEIVKVSAQSPIKDELFLEEGAFIYKTTKPITGEAHDKIRQVIARNRKYKGYDYHDVDNFRKNEIQKLNSYLNPMGAEVYMGEAVRVVVSDSDLGDDIYKDDNGKNSSESGIVKTS